MKILPMPYSRAFYHFLPHDSKYSPQYSVLSHPQSLFISWWKTSQASDTYKTADKSTFLYILMFNVLDSRE